MNPQAVGQPSYPAATGGPPTSTSTVGVPTGAAVLPPPPSYVPPHKLLHRHRCTADAGRAGWRYG